MRPAPPITAIVCTSDRWDFLPACLDSLLRQDRATGAEILVVDNGRDPDAAHGRLPAGVRLVRSAPPGLSRARNRGVAEAGAELVAFIDDDAEAEPGWLAAIMGTFAAHPEAAAVGGPVVPLWPGARPRWLHTDLDGFFSIVDRGPRPRPLAAGEWLAGTNIAFRADALRETGGFDEALGRRPGRLLGNEEIAAVARLRAAGHAIRYDPAIAVRHRIHPDRVSRAWLRRRVVWQAFSDLLMDGSHAPPDTAALWARVHDSLAGQPAHLRNLVGLTRDHDDPAAMRAQAGALEALVPLLALSGESLEALLAASA